MFDPSSPLYHLHAAAALASGWPRLRVLAADAPTLVALAEQLAERLGPLPQADEIEPFEPGDPDDPWELRLDLPELSPEDWARVQPLLADHEHEWTPGTPPEVTTADDLGVRLVDWLDGGGLAARMPIAVDDGQQRLDLRRAPGIDPALAALETELAQALHDRAPRLQLSSDRGLDTITAVVHRTSGRLGVELWLGPQVWDGLDGDQELALRREAVTALARVVHQRAGHDTLRLAPDPHWGLRLGGMALVAWLVAPHQPPLPGDAPLPMGTSPHPVALGGLLRDAEGLVHDLEVQVVHDDHDAALAMVLEAGADRWLGGPPRWVRHDDRWHFVPTWRAPLSTDTATIVDRLKSPVRIVPGRLVGLEEEDPWLVRHAVWGRQRLALRVRDGVRDDDREPRWADRAPTHADAPLMAAAIHALGSRAQALVPHEGLPVRPVHEGDRRGLQLSLPPSAVPDAHEVLTSLADADGLGPWIDWSFPRGGGLRIHLWHHGGASDRRWR